MRIVIKSIAQRAKLEIGGGKSPISENTLNCQVFRPILVVQNSFNLDMSETIKIVI